MQFKPRAVLPTVDHVDFDDMLSHESQHMDLDESLPAAPVASVVCDPPTEVRFTRRWSRIRTFMTLSR